MDKSSVNDKRKTVGNPISLGLIPFLAIGIDLNQLADITSINADRLKHLMRNESGNATWSAQEQEKINKSMHRLRYLSCKKQQEINQYTPLEFDLFVQQVAEETCYWLIEQGYDIEEIARMTSLSTEKVSECLFMRQDINNKL